jgi:hypothetical protein
MLVARDKEDVRLQVGESVLQQVCYETTQEILVAGASRCLIRGINGTLDLGNCSIGRMNQIEHLRQERRLRLESSLVIRVGKHEKNILQDRNEELLKEGVRCCWVGLCNIADQLETHVETSVFDFAVVVLACPHAGVDNKLELSIVKLQKSYHLLAFDNNKMQGGIPGKQWILIARRREKNSTLCSGNSEKSLLIISKVHSKTFSMIVGTWSSIRD